MMNKRLLSLGGNSKKWIGLTVLMNWISIICNIGIILLVGNVINKVYEGNFDFSLGSYIVFIGLMLIIRFTCNFYSTKFSYHSSADVRKLLRESVYKKLLELGVSYNDTISTSSIVQISVDGIEALEVYFGRYLPQLFYSLLAPTTLFFVVSTISFKSALVLLLCVPLIPVSIIAVMKIAKKLLSKYWNIYTNLGDSFLENLQGLSTLKVFDLDKEKNDTMNEEAEDFRKITMKVLSMQLNSITIMDLVAFLGSAIGILVAVNEFSQGKITVGGVLIIILLSSEFFIPLRLLGSYFHVAMNGISASDKIFDLLDTKLEKQEDISKEEKELLKDINIRFNNVDFSYDKERKILKDINIDIKNKNMVALVGESGCGKSTITNLLLKIKKVDEGEILLNGLNIDYLPFNVLREKIGFISHNSYIFNGTIEDNLRMGKADASEKEINKALKEANLYEFVESLPSRLKTNVGEGGSLLSGGQKQRLALARIIISDPQILIFDEATSNIDVESEEKIWDAIHKLSKDKTVLVISHRLANVVKSDVIYVLDKGEIVESGAHDELLENQSKYYDLYTHQQNLEKIYFQDELTEEAAKVKSRKEDINEEVAISGE